MSKGNGRMHGARVPVYTPSAPDALFAMERSCLPVLVTVEPPANDIDWSGCTEPNLDQGR